MRKFLIMVLLLCCSISLLSARPLTDEEAVRQHVRNYKRLIRNHGWPPLDREYTNSEWVEWKMSGSGRGWDIPINQYYANPEAKYKDLIGTSWWVKGHNCVEYWQFAEDSILIDVYHYYAGPTPSSKARSSRNCWLRIWSNNKEFTDTVKTKRYCKNGWPAYWYPNVPERDRNTGLWVKDLHQSSSNGVVYKQYDVYRVSKFHCKDLKVTTFIDGMGKARQLISFYMKEYCADGETPVYGFTIPMYYIISGESSGELKIRSTEIEYINQRNWKMVFDKPEGRFTKKCPLPLDMWMWKTK